MKDIERKRPPVRPYTAFLNSTAKDYPSAKEALRVVVREIEEAGFIPRTDTYNAIISTSCTGSEALEVLQLLRAEGRAPGVPGLNRVVTLLGAEGRYDDALDLIETHMVPLLVGYERANAPFDTLASKMCSLTHHAPPSPQHYERLFSLIERIDTQTLASINQGVLKAETLNTPLLSQVPLVMLAQTSIPNIDTAWALLRGTQAHKRRWHIAAP